MVTIRPCPWVWTIQTATTETERLTRWQMILEYLRVLYR